MKLPLSSRIGIWDIPCPGIAAMKQKLLVLTVCGLMLWWILYINSVTQESPRKHFKTKQDYDCSTHWIQPPIQHYSHPKGQVTLAAALMERVQDKMVHMVENWPVKTSDIEGSTGMPDSLALVQLIMFMERVTTGDFRILEFGSYVGSTSSAMAYTMQKEFQGRQISLTTADKNTRRFKIPQDLASIVSKRAGWDHDVISKMVRELPRPQLNLVFLDATMNPKSLPMLITMLHPAAVVAFHDANLPSESEVELDKGFLNIVRFNEALLAAERQCQWFIHSLPATTFPPYDLKYQATLTLSNGKRQSVNSCVAMCIPESIVNVQDYPKVYNFHGLPSDLRLTVNFKPVGDRLVGQVDRAQLLPRIAAADLCQGASLKLVTLDSRQGQYPDVRASNVGPCSFLVSVPRLRSKTTLVVFWLTSYGPVFGGYFHLTDDSV